MQIKQRRLLVLLLAISQLGCMSFGVVWATRWLQRTFDEFITNAVVAQGRSLAFEVAHSIDDASVTTVEPGSDGWNALQNVCETVDVPHNGFVVVMRRDTGALACHSRLEHDPELLGSFPGRQTLVRGRSVTPIIEAADEAVAAGEPLFA